MIHHEVEACAQRVRVRDHLRRPLAGSRNLLMKTAGNTVSETVPMSSVDSVEVPWSGDYAPKADVVLPS